jgi:hypothetical protein
MKDRKKYNLKTIAGLIHYIIHIHSMSFHSYLISVTSKVRIDRQANDKQTYF